MGLFRGSSKSALEVLGMKAKPEKRTSWAGHCMHQGYHDQDQDLTPFAADTICRSVVTGRKANESKGLGMGVLKRRDFRENHKFIPVNAYEKDD
jgi:hypothetical protein